MTIQMIEVKSSNIQAIGYNEQTQTLRVQFNTGGVYNYFGVSKQVYEDFLNAKSIGAYFSKSIRNDYKCVKELT